ncbi:MAG: DUF45 domain-containing protein [Methyloprofundus sp.]|nr:DUF45 domain-containing protein [Methyloprofundus sp.]
MKTQAAYQIRRSPRAKRARIIVTADKIEVVAPLRMPEKQIKLFMQEKQLWVENAKNQVAEHAANITSFAPKSYQQGAMIPYQANQYPLLIELTKSSQLRIEFNQENFTLYIAKPLYSTLSAAELSEKVRELVITWMFQAAREQAIKSLDHYAPLYQLKPRSITIKAVKSRWGSCGIHNDINLNWLLILAPAEVYEYVVIHELCHIQQRNHSAAFWALVAQHCPDYKQRRAWLKQQGASLMLGL